MGGRPPTDDFFLRKLRLSLEDFPDPNEKNHKLLFIILFLLTISCPKYPILSNIMQNGLRFQKNCKKSSKMARK